MTGQVRFYDPASAWGVIAGDDGQLYTVRGSQVAGSPPREGDKVHFEPVSAAGGQRAVGVRRIRRDPAVKSSP
jgi:cold shock CspA family protein